MARKILLADDSVTAQNMGRKILADAGYEVLTVNNGSAALKKITEAKPELIILDVYMPGYSGLEVCQRLKEAQETSRIPVLLTVGKLEPFKPEEAKRVRADGYIVKPFEASELLSALSKLEDKMVPRSEPSKPGRFARANAALDEARDKTVSIDEDSGWKNRIAFPTKKKKAEEDETPVEDPAIYNAVNKDLRTTVDHAVVAQPYLEKNNDAEKDEKVNLEALAAAQGLPKDVTPEEIAALAAAAAQVKATVEGAKAAEAAEKHEEVMPSPADVMAAIVALEVESLNGPASNGGNGSHTRRTSDEPVTMAVAAQPEPAASAHRWTAVAVALDQEESTASLEHEMQQAQEVRQAPQPRAEVIQEVIQEANPVVAVAAESAPIASVAEAPAEPARESEPVPTVEASLPEPVPQPEAVATSSPEAGQEHSQEEVEKVAPEASATTVVANMATEAIAAAVQQLEAVAAAYEAERAGKASESTGAQVSDFAQAAADVMQPSEAKPDAEKATEKSETLTSAAPESVETNAASAVSEIAVTAQDLSKPESIESAILSQSDQAQPSQANAASAEQESQPESIHETAHETAQEAAHQASQESTPKLETADTQVAAAAPEPVTGSSSSVAGGSPYMAKKESEIAETTAAAWASWRRIRESADPKPTAQEQDEAAMAVAAGAETAPEESGPSDPTEIASIVDSVLADLRPKIVEEISRKLGKKK